MSFLIRHDSDSKKLKSLLKTSLERIKISKSKRCTLAKQARNDAALLLMKDQYEKAESRVENVFREENTVDAYEQLEGYCQLILDRADTLKTDRECPAELKGVIGALFYAAPRCGDLPELHDCRNMLKSRYGDVFSVVASENQPESGVNKIVKFLSSKTPSQDMKLNLLKQIALENNINWTWDNASSARKNNSFVQKPKDVPSSVDKANTNQNPDDGVKIRKESMTTRTVSSQQKPKDVPSSYDKADTNQNPDDGVKIRKESMTTRTVSSSSQEDDPETKTPSKYNLPLSSSNKYSNEEFRDHQRVSDGAKVVDGQISSRNRFTRSRQEVMKNVSLEHEGRSSSSSSNRAADVKRERERPNDNHASRMSTNEFAKTQAQSRSKTKADLLDLQTAAEVARKSAAEAVEAADLAFSIIESNYKKKMNAPSIPRTEKVTSQKLMDQRIAKDESLEFVPPPNKASSKFDENVREKNLSRAEMSDGDSSSSRYRRRAVDPDGKHLAQLPPKYDDEDEMYYNKVSKAHLPSSRGTGNNRQTQTKPEAVLELPRYDDYDDGEEEDMPTYTRRNEVKEVSGYDRHQRKVPLSYDVDSKGKWAAEEAMPTYARRNGVKVLSEYDHHQRKVPLSSHVDSKGELAAEMLESSRQRSSKAAGSDYARHNSSQEDGGWSAPYPGHVESRLMKQACGKSAGRQGQQYEDLHERVAELAMDERYVRQSGKPPNRHLRHEDEGYVLSEEPPRTNGGNRTQVLVSGYRPDPNSAFATGVGDRRDGANTMSRSSAWGQVRQQGGTRDDVVYVTDKEDRTEASRPGSQRTRRSSRQDDLGHGVP